MHEKNFTPVMSGFGYVYTLSSETGEIFYVGCTTVSVSARFNQHISEAKRNSIICLENPKNQKIRELNYKIVATQVEEVWLIGERIRRLTEKLEKVEKSWIEKFLKEGINLTNREPRKRVSNKTGK